jgi:hypothetical protein
MVRKDRGRYQRVPCLGADFVWDNGDILGQSAPP